MRADKENAVRFWRPERTYFGRFISAAGGGSPLDGRGDAGSGPTGHLRFAQRRRAGRSGEPARSNRRRVERFLEQPHAGTKDPFRGRRRPGGPRPPADHLRSRSEKPSERPDGERGALSPKGGRGGEDERQEHSGDDRTEDWTHQQSCRPRRLERGPGEGAAGNLRKGGAVSGGRRELRSV